MSDFNKSQVSRPTDSGGRNQRSLPVRPNSDLENPTSSAGISNRRSKPCYQFLKGKCYNVSCRFSHVHGDIQKIQECPMSSTKGNCPFGDTCKYLHKDDQIRGQNQDDQNRGQNQDNDSVVVHKKKPCKLWMKSGACHFGETCRFAHGKAELRETHVHAELRETHVHAETGNSSTLRYDKLEERHFSKNDSRKISEVYADWIDDE